MVRATGLAFALLLGAPLTACEPPEAAHELAHELAPDAGSQLPPGCIVAPYAPTEGEDPFCPADHDHLGELVGDASYWHATEACNAWLYCDVDYVVTGRCFHCAAWSWSPEYLDPPLIERLAE